MLEVATIANKIPARSNEDIFVPSPKDLVHATLTRCNYCIH